MRMVYTSKIDRIVCYKNYFDNPELIYDMLIEFGTLLSIPQTELSLKLPKGKWQIIDNKVLKVIEGGFDMIDLDILEPVKIERSRLEIDDDWTRLIDIDTGYRLYNIETGLLSSEYRPDKQYNFKVFGLNFNDLSNIGAFNQNFNVARRSRLETIILLHDLKVSKPKITDITKRRLKLEDWDTRKEENISEDITLEDNTSIMDQLMDVEFDKDDLKTILNDEVYLTGFNELVNFISTTEIIYSMKTIQKVQHTRRIYNLIKNLKYDLICRHVLLDMKVNKRVINNIPKMFDNENSLMLHYSMVSLYDRIIQADSAPSPQGYYMDIDPKFISKFRDDENE
jgi:hypothetical protein